MEQPPVQQPVDSAETTALVLGIVSIVLAGCVPVSLPCGYIGLKKANRVIGQIDTGARPPNGRGMAVAGKVCSIVGLCLGGLSALIWVFYLFMALIMVLAGAAGVAGAAGGP